MEEERARKDEMQKTGITREQSKKTNENIRHEEKRESSQEKMSIKILSSEVENEKVEEMEKKCSGGE